MNSTRGRLGTIVPILASLGLGLAIWHIATSFSDIPRYVLPTPKAVSAALLDGISQSPWVRSSFWFHLFDTLKATVYGFCIGAMTGLVLAALMAESRLIEAAALPYVVGLQSLPKVAIAPLLVIWLGYGIESKVAMASVLTLFPVLINALQGFRSSARERLEMMAALKASRWQVFRFIKLPGALPMIFAGLHIGIVYAMLGTIVSEFTGAQKGMGVIITQMQTVSDTAGVFAALVLLGCTGYVLISIMRALQRKIVFWAEGGGQGVGI
ncbi:MAG: ABC transporter permease [Burkholderiales bacterium]